MAKSTTARAFATIKSLTGFIDMVGEQTPAGSRFLVFRGQRNIAWPANPGIIREPKKLLSHERELVRELVSVHPQEFKDDTGMFDRLVRMQHFGLPTRLLDVTINPLVALYFATEPFGSRKNFADGVVNLYEVPLERRKYYDSDAVSCLSNLANLSDDEKEHICKSRGELSDVFNEIEAIDRLIQFVRSEKPYFRARIIADDLFIPYFVVPKMNNRRIIAQSGAFIIFGLEHDVEAKGSSVKNPILRNGIIIPQDAKSQIRRDLDALGINESTMFPELEKAAIHLVRKYG